MVLLLYFYLGIEGNFVVVIVVGGESVVFVVVFCLQIGGVVVVLVFILFCVGCEDMDSWMRLDVVVCLLLLSQSNFVLVVVFVGMLGFYVVVIDFQLGVYDWCLFVYWMDIYGVSGRIVFVVQIYVLVYCYVYQVLVIVEVYCVVIQNVDYVVVVIDVGFLRVVVVSGGYCVSGVLNYKFVEVVLDRLSMFIGLYLVVF